MNNGFYEVARHSVSADNADKACASVEGKIYSLLGAPFVQRARHARGLNGRVHDAYEQHKENLERFKDLELERELFLLVYSREFQKEIEVGALIPATREAISGVYGRVFHRDAFNARKQRENMQTKSLSLAGLIIECQYFLPFQGLFIASNYSGVVANKYSLLNKDGSVAEHAHDLKKGVDHVLNEIQKLKESISGNAIEETRIFFLIRRMLNSDVFINADFNRPLTRRLLPNSSLGLSNFIQLPLDSIFFDQNRSVKGSWQLSKKGKELMEGCRDIAEYIRSHSTE